MSKIAFAHVKSTTMARQASRMESLLQALPAGVVVINTLGIIEQCNLAAKALLGQDILGCRWIDVIQAAFAPQRDDGHEVSLKDGRRVSLLTRALEEEPGQLIVLTDLTETRNLQDKMSHQQKLADMGKMTASLAHQIRTPLSAAVLYAESLGHPELSSQQREKFSLKMLSCLKSLEAKIQDMLHYVRGEKAIKGHHAIDDIFQAVEVCFEFDDITLQFSADDVQTLNCQREAVIGALHNLIHNALQAGANTVNIVVEKRESYIEFSVIDDGPGIPEALHEQVFEPFFTTKSQGTGLGLAVVQAVAQSHQGQLRIDQNYKQGASIIFSILQS